MAGPGRVCPCHVERAPHPRPDKRAGADRDAVVIRFGSGSVGDADAAPRGWALACRRGAGPRIFISSSSHPRQRGRGRRAARGCPVSLSGWSWPVAGGGWGDALHRSRSASAVSCSGHAARVQRRGASSKSSLGPCSRCQTRKTAIHSSS